MTVGGRCGKRRSITIESFKHSKGQLARGLGHRLPLPMTFPAHLRPLLNLLPHRSLSLLRHFRLRLNLPVPVVLPHGANARRRTIV